MDGVEQWFGTGRAEAVRSPWYTRRVTEHRVHLLWLAGRGLHLWVERVEGHAVVVDSATLGPDDLAAPLLDLVKSRALRRRDGMRVATPKGQVREISLYTQAWTPEQALTVLGTLSAYLRGGGDISQLSAETVWLVRLYELLLEIVDTGRVMMKLHFADGQWFPVWCVSSSGVHNRILREFQASCPVVLTLNGGDDVLLRAADELVHWMCVARLQERSAATGTVFDNHFVAALVSGEADRRLTPVVAHGLAAWRRSATENSTRLVLMLQEPQGAAADDGDDDDSDTGAEPVDPEARRWRLGVRLSVDDAPAAEIPASEAGDREKRVLRPGLDAAYRAWPPLRETATAVEGWLRTGVWFPESAALTGRPAEDRVLSLALTMADVEALLSEGVAALTMAGVDVLVPRGWSTVRPAVKVRISPVGAGPAEGRMGMEQVLSFDWDISVDGEQLSPLQKHDLLTSARSVVQVKGRYVRLDGDSLSRARSYFRTVTEAQQAAEKDRKDAARTDDPHPLVSLGDLLSAELASQDRTWNADEDLEIDAEGWVGRMLAAQHPREGDGEMPALTPPERVEPPTSLTVTLRDHQQRGLNWLVWMFRHRLGAVLADDMGLGKTLQVLALLAWEREHGELTGPTLVVAPTSVLEAWNSEVAQHVPSLRVLVDHGSGKVPEEQFPAAAEAVDLVLTTYGTVGRNPARYAGLRWGRVVADEAQNIKNPGTAQSRAVRAVPADHRIALSGTPVENRLSELHTLMDFCNPGLLGSAKAFHNAIGSHIERDREPEDVERLRRLVDPFILRREKTDASLDLGLPEKREYIDSVTMTAEQAALYQAYAADVEDRLANSRSDRRSGLVLTALTHFKEICNHPAHFSGDGSGIRKDGRHRSGKVERLYRIVAEALEQDRRVLVFTQFPSFGRMLAPDMEEVFGIEVPMLHGGLNRKARVDLVNRFQSENGPKVMILSTRAGGTGITLTRASVVIHIDRWWNPAVEDQATDRAYRIGQGQDVRVHKLIAVGTLDERINDILGAKRDLAGDVVSAGESWLTRMDDASLKDLWRLNTSTSDRRLGTGGAEGEAALQEAMDRIADNWAEFQAGLLEKYPAKDPAKDREEDDCE